MRRKTKKQAPDPRELLKKFEPHTDPELSFLFCEGDLDPSEPSKKACVSLFYSEEGLRAYGEEGLLWRLSSEELEAVRIRRGVGCFSLIAVETNGTERLILRGTPQRLDAASNFAVGVDRMHRQAEINERKHVERPQKPRKTGTKRAILQLIKMAKPEWKYVMAAVVCFFATTGTGLLLPYLRRLLVDDYIRAEVADPYLMGFVGTVLTILFFNLIQRGITLARGYFLAEAGNHLIVRLRDTVFRKIQELSISKISQQTSGELMKRVSGDTGQIKQFLINQLPHIMEQAILLLAISILLFAVDPVLALLILLPAPFVMLSFLLFWRLMRRLSARIRGLNAKGNAILHDIFSGIRVVKSYGMEKREEERFVSTANDERRVHMRQERIWAFLMPFLNLLMGMGEYVLLYYIGSKMLVGEMTAGEMSQMSSYAGMVYAPLATLLRAPRMFVHMITSVTAVFELLDEPTDIADPKEKPAVTELKGNISLEHVSFGYDRVDKVLRDVSLEIRAGEFIGIVGRSGVGKSTLINLIMRMYDVDDGAIRVDGIDIRDLPQQTLRSQMGVVLQENFLFTGTVLQNLTYAKPNATREEVIAASKAAGAHDFILRLPDGYQTVIGERGHTLSGGERQRVAIARALLHDPRILILDEATSALDTETEKLVQDALQALSRGRTTIAIAHRLSTLRNATRLVVLDRGGVAEVGTHDELMALGGIYHGLVMAQRELSRIESTD